MDGYGKGRGSSFSEDSLLHCIKKVISFQKNKIIKHLKGKNKRKSLLPMIQRKGKPKSTKLHYESIFDLNKICFKTFFFSHFSQHPNI